MAETEHHPTGDDHGTRIVKAFNMEGYEQSRFARENRRLLGIQVKSTRVRAISHPLMEFLGGLGIAFIVFYGGITSSRGLRPREPFSPSWLRSSCSTSRSRG